MVYPLASLFFAKSSKSRGEGGEGGERERGWGVGGRGERGGEDGGREKFRKRERAWWIWPE